MKGHLNITPRQECKQWSELLSAGAKEEMRRLVLLGVSALSVASSKGEPSHKEILGDDNLNGYEICFCHSASHGDNFSAPQSRFTKLFKHVKNDL